MKIPADFIGYVLDFYGKGGIYDFGATKQMVVAATLERIDKYPVMPFDGDSFDREIVRDIILNGEVEL